jgi:dTDP-4-dehydrorhamnose 3,5-epimerase
LNIWPTTIPEVIVIGPKVFDDARGFFFESYNKKIFAEKLGITNEFVQDNQSHSTKNVLRGLHYQIKQAQGKLVRVIAGEAFNVAVDLRRQSPTFGEWVGTNLSSESKRMLWVPPGFAHGFLSLSEACDLIYKTTGYWHAEHERCLLWNDPALGINWPISGEPQLAAKDVAGKRLRDAEVYP